MDPGTPDDAGYSAAIAQLVRDKCDLIVGNYSPQGMAIMKLSAVYPDQNFMLVGGGSDLPNVWVTKYSLPEQAYLAGYLAAAASTSGKVGTFGDQQIPNMVSSMNCFAEGVNEYDKAKLAAVTVLGWDSINQLGLVADDLKNPDQGIRFTNDLISQGADIIFPMAGSGMSSTAAAIMSTARQHAGVNLIGVDLDWAWALPDYASGIISSARVRVDQSIALAAEAVASGEFHGGGHAGTLASGEIGLAPLSVFPGAVPADLSAQMAKLADSGAIDFADTNMNINGFPDLDSVDGANWPANTWVTIRIESPEGETLFTGDARTDQVGHFFVPVGVDLVPGMVVVVDGCLSSRSTTIVPMSIDVIDMENDIVSGRAPSGTRNLDRGGRNWGVE